MISRYLRNKPGSFSFALKLDKFSYTLNIFLKCCENLFFYLTLNNNLLSIFWRWLYIYSKYGICCTEYPTYNKGDMYITITISE